MTCSNSKYALEKRISVTSKDKAVFYLLPCKFPSLQQLFGLTCKLFKFGSRGAITNEQCFQPCLTASMRGGIPIYSNELRATSNLLKLDVAKNDSIAEDFAEDFWTFLMLLESNMTY